MRMVKQETHHNAPGQIMGYVQAALEVVADVDPPEDLRAAVFTAAVNLASAKTIQLMPESSGLLVPAPQLGGV